MGLPVDGRQIERLKGEAKTKPFRDMALLRDMILRDSQPEEVCEWKCDYKDKIYDGHSTPHGKKYYIPAWDFTFCPYCSRKIKVVE